MWKPWLGKPRPRSPPWTPNMPEGKAQAVKPTLGPIGKDISGRQTEWPQKGFGLRMGCSIPMFEAWKQVWVDITSLEDTALLETQ